MYPTIQHQHHSTDVIRTGQARALIGAYLNTLALPAAAAGPLAEALNDWCTLRQSRGWGLTAAGLGITLDKLYRLAEGDPARMYQIAARTVRHGWKSFYPYREDAPPDGIPDAAPVADSTAPDAYEFLALR